jgi:hypothetical protein
MKFNTQGQCRSNETISTKKGPMGFEAPKIATWNISGSLTHNNKP